MSSREWTRYVQEGTRTRVVEASCCDAYRLLQEGGTYVVTRRRRHPSFEETARGPASPAKDVFRDLVALHLGATQKHRP